MRLRSIWPHALLLATAVMASAGPLRAEMRVEKTVPSVGSGVRFEPTRTPVTPVALPAPSPAATAPGPLAPVLGASAECFNIDTDATLNDGFRFIPPDPYCAVGPNHVLNIGNVILEWRPKEGILNTPQFQSSLKAFFAALPAPAPNPGPGTTLGTYGYDPKVIYDQYAGRFIVVMLERWDTASGNASNQSRILLAISKTSDPNGGFWFHAIDSKLVISANETWADYPGIAVDDKAVYITNNMFAFIGAGGSFLGERLWIIRKTTAYAGPNNSISSIVRDPYAAAGVPTTTMPAHMFGPPPTGSSGRPMGTFLVSYSALSDGTNEYLQFVEVTDPLQTVGGPFFTVQQLNLGDIESNPLPAMPPAPQLGSSFQIATNDRRLLNAVWRANNLYCTATYVPPSGPNMNQATARWWRLNTTVTTALTQSDKGDVGGEDIAVGTYTFFPQVMVDGDGNMAMGFAASAPTVYCGAYYTTRMAGDPAGTVSSSAALAAGTDFYKRFFGGTRNRWGDYSGLALCPVGEADFWVYNEYAGTRGSAGTGSQGAEDGRWYTRVGKFRVRLPTAVGTPVVRASLAQNVPNPFNPITTIRFTLVSRENVTLAVYDTAGRQVRRLAEGSRDGGSHDIVWDGRDGRGNAVASGVYFYRLTAGSFSDSKKMVLLK